MQVEKNLNFPQKIPYLTIFRLQFEKLLSCLTLAFNLSECNTSCKTTFLNLESNLSDLGIFGLELGETTVL